jgi:adenine-specific DNA-methyltransferase
MERQIEGAMSGQEIPVREPETLELRSMNVSEQRIAALGDLFPEALTEGGKLDFDKLKLALGEDVDVGKERYGLIWPGKAECFKTIQAPSLGTLRPRPEESINWSTTENLIIEGDNLEVLKLLQKSYLGKVKMIYIDPPYNTGNDFIYPDNYTDSLQTYLEYTGQVDPEGRKFSTNADTDGRFHSKWLNMMYPRLYLARNLLREDGVIFISIDDSEVSRMRQLCDEIFGEEAFLVSLVWRRRSVADSRNETLASTDHEYVLVYGAAQARLLGSAIDKTKFSNPDDDPRGPWRSADLTGLATAERRPNLHYDLKDPETGLTYPPLVTRGWGVGKEKMAQLIEEGRVLWPKSPQGRPRIKLFLGEVKRDVTSTSSWLDYVGSTAEGTQAVQDLFDEKIFPFPKPLSLLSALVEQANLQAGDIALDFFAGSGSLAQAVLEINGRDLVSRRFILVQLPEPTGREDYPTIADIAKERVRRVIKKLEEQDEGTLHLDGQSVQDRGFRVFKLDESNFTTWDARTPENEDTLAEQLELHVDHVRHGRGDQDLLFELLLKCGFPLATPIEELTLAGNAVYSVLDGALVVCLGREVTQELIVQIADLDPKPERVVFLDEGFEGNDQLKVNASETFRTKGIMTFKTV